MKNDNVAFNTIGMDPSAPLAYAMGPEHHQTTMSTLGGHGCRLERLRYIPNF